MVTKLLLAAILPALLVWFFARITFNHFVAVLLTIALLVAAYYKGHSQEVSVLVVDTASVVVGYFLAKRFVKKP